MTRKRNLIFYCQHSLGMGHLVRSFALADALAREFDVTFLNGGELPSGIRIPDSLDILSLPPLGMGVDNKLYSRDPAYTVDAAKMARRRIILSTLAGMTPSVIVVELFPFGRKKFADELVPLLEAAHTLGPDRPLILCSLRDILVNDRRDKVAHDDWACGLLNRYFDGVLAHSDPKFSRIEETFEPSFPLEVPIHYTGFVLPTRDDQSRPERERQIVVSAGGGIVGGPLLRAAVEAQPSLSAHTDVSMKVIAGPFLPEDEWQALLRLANGRDGLELVRSVRDVGAELVSAAASVSQCGYNTAMDILYSGVSALVVPFYAGQEDEQLNRARRLEQLGALRVLDPDRLDAASLADEMRMLLDFRPRANALDLDGAAGSATLIGRMLTQQSGPIGRRKFAAAKELAL